MAYVGDITYIRTREGWLYLSTVIDLYARTLVGWDMGERLHTALISNALHMARSRRTSLEGAIFHSDRGSQYALDVFKAHLKHYGMIQSMSARGNCYDNAVAESFFHTLKTELIHHVTFHTKQEAIGAIILTPSSSSRFVNYCTYRYDSISSRLLTFKETGPFLLGIFTRPSLASSCKDSSTPKTVLQ